MRSTALDCRKLSIDPEPNTTGSASLSVQTPPPPFASADMVLTCSATAACFWMRMTEYRPVTGISTAMATTVILAKADWITNQSCNRLAAFLMADHRPVAAGVALPGFDKSDMAVFRGRRRVMYRSVMLGGRNRSFTTFFCQEPAEDR